MTRVYIGIGSNVDRELRIRAALTALSALGSSPVVSPVYESRAWGFEGGNFYNLVVGLDTEMTVEDINQALRVIEDRNGRDRTMPRFSSRSLDLDLLMYDSLVQHDGTIDIPRPDILGCAFVLRPLVDIAGAVIHPETGRTLAEHWREFDMAGQETWVAAFEP